MSTPVTPELIKKAAAGDRAAFEQIYGEYRDEIAAFVTKCCGSAIYAEDITHETFLKALERLPELRDTGAFRGWLYSIAYRLCLDSFTDESRRRDISSGEELDALLERAGLNEPIDLPQETAESAETREQVRRQIDRLRPDCRRAVILYYYDDLPLEEVAEKLGVTEPAARQKLYRARKSIKRGLEKLTAGGAVLCAVPLGNIVKGSFEAGQAASIAKGGAMVKSHILLKVLGAAAAGGAAAAVPYAISRLSDEGLGDYHPITGSDTVRRLFSKGGFFFDIPGFLLTLMAAAPFIIGIIHVIRGYRRSRREGKKADGLLFLPLFAGALLTVFLGIQFREEIKVFLIELDPTNKYYSLTYGTSERYTREDIDAAAEAVCEKLRSMKSCYLTSLEYAGDGRVKSEEEYFTARIRKEKGFSQNAELMVFESSFRTPEFYGVSSGSWSGRICDWNWILAREPGGEWEVVNYGYG